MAKQRNLTIVTAESYTAGMLSTILSEAPGASEHLHGGFVTYTKENKTKALGVSEHLLSEKSAVCAEVAIAMAEGALKRSLADLAVAVTGVAGPEPDERFPCLQSKPATGIPASLACGSRQSLAPTQ